MPFFQNPIDTEFRGSLILDDRTYSPTFTIAANRNKSDAMVAWNEEPYDLSSHATLTLYYAFDSNFKNYSKLAISVSGATASATTAAEIVALLNANATFAEMFVARLIRLRSENANNLVTPFSVQIVAKSGRPKPAMRVYIENTGAELKMRFNSKALVAELPTYFARHTIENRFVFADSFGTLIQLDESDSDDQEIITNAGFDYSDMKEDYELLRGRSNAFLFKKITVDGSNRMTQVIEYPAGAQEGDLAKKTQYVYTSANTTPDKITEVPYTLEAADLVTP